MLFSFLSIGKIHNFPEPESSAEARDTLGTEGAATSGDDEVDASEPGNRNGGHRQHPRRPLSRPESVCARG